MKKLNLGCGRDIRQGWINLDIKELPGVDVAHNVEDLPLPFDDQSFDEILARDILEHIDYIPVLKELHRILKGGGQLAIQVPHFTSVDNFIDPTHRCQFSIQTFDFFVAYMNDARDYYFDFAFQNIVSRKIGFTKRPFFCINYVLEPLVNMNTKSLKFYEATGLSRLFPAANISIVLVK